MKKVSVIIPVYNTEEFLVDCIESVQKQTYENIEIIIVNDNSEDNSLDLAYKLQENDERIEIYNIDKNRGVGFARNLAIEKATGDYVYFLDSDDYIPKNTIKFLLTNIGDSPLIRGRLRNTNFSSSFAVVFSGTFNPRLYSEDRFNLLKHETVVNFLISKQFIKDSNLTFSENLNIYTDFSFVINLLTKTEIIPYLNEAIYFKRTRPDPILNPSLKQSSDKQIILDYLKMYISTKNTINDNDVIEFLDTNFLNFYRKTIINYFKVEDDIEHIYTLLKNATKLLNHSIINKYDWVLKRELKYILTHDVHQYSKLINKHNFYRALKNGVRSRHNFNKFLYDYFFTKLPVNNNFMFFESFAGKSYSDSPKYIYEYVENNSLNKKAVWSFEAYQNIPGKGKQVKRFSLKYYYYLAKSKYWIVNARMPNNLFKRPETTYIQTWHGTPLKRLAGDLDNVFMPGTNSATYKRNFNNETKKWDYLVSPNSYSSKIFKRAFWFDGKLLEFGYPRNDVLYNKNNSHDINLIKNKLKLPTDKKVVLYAPTWRDDEYYSVGKYQFSLKLNLDKMQKVLGDEYIIILRMHYLIASELDISQYESFAYDLSSYNDISELYLVSDILITDYSSVFFDYANLKRPILFYTYDLDKYRDQLRGFYLDIENDVPGPLLQDTNEVINAIENIQTINKNYKQKYNEFYNRFCQWDDGNASKNIIDYVLRK